MNRFIEACQKEWRRLGVPEAAANEMAADLEVDLAEAQADGVSPEEVLGNGYFDAKSFAASWATARGVVNPKAAPGVPAAAFRARPLTLILIGLVSLAAGALGLAILVGRRAGEMSVAAVAFRHSVPQPVPGLFVTHRFGFAGPGGSPRHRGIRSAAGRTHRSRRHALALEAVATQSTGVRAQSRASHLPLTG